MKKPTFEMTEEMRLFFCTTGAKGGKKRAAGMTAKQRSEGARKASLARWGKKTTAKLKKTKPNKKKEK